MKNESGYAAKAVSGGALTTLVHLGHPVIAMRTLQAALADKAVDISTAVWLIDQVLNGTNTVGDRSDLAVSKQDAAELLLSLVEQLPDDARPGYAIWPSCASGRWPADLDVQTGMNLVFALLATLTSRPESWWTSRDLTWLWAIDTLVSAAEDRPGTGTCVKSPQPTQRFCSPRSTSRRSTSVRPAGHPENVGPGSSRLPDQRGNGTSRRPVDRPGAGAPGGRGGLADLSAAPGQSTVLPVGATEQRSLIDALVSSRYNSPSAR